MLAVLQGKAARVLLACTRRLVLSEFLLVPTGRREPERYLRVPNRQLQQWIGGAETPERPAGPLIDAFTSKKRLEG